MAGGGGRPEACRSTPLEVVVARRGGGNRGPVLASPMWSGIRTAGETGSSATTEPSSTKQTCSERGSRSACICGTSRVYSGGEVAYVITNPPAGY